MNDGCKYKAIFFDLDNTLYPQAKDVEQRINYVCKKLNLTDGIHKFWYDLWLEKGSLYPSIIDDVITQFDLKYKKEALLKHYREAKTNLSFTPQILQNIKALRVNNYKLFIVTNGNKQIQESKIESLNIESIFDEIAISTGKYSKPDPYWVNYFMNKYNLNNTECLFLGDSELTDGRVALNTNIDFILTDYTIINKLLDKINER